MISTDLLPLLLDASLKAAMILLLAASVQWLLPKASAATKHLLWTVALCACLGVPMLTALLPEWGLALLPVRTATIMTAPSIAPLLEIKYAPQLEAMSFDPPPRQVIETPAPSNWSIWIIAIWGLGAWLVVARTLIGFISIALMKSSAQPLQHETWRTLLVEAATLLRLKKRVTLFVSEAVSVPMTTGIIRPIILLPADALHWSREQLKTVLLHELAHIKRRDCLTQMLANVACALYWFNPLAWVAAWQMRKLREQACDDEVLAAGTRASAYASCLVEVAKSVDTAKYSSPVAVGMACSPLADRVKSILDPTTNRRKLSRRSMMLIATLAVSLMLPLAALNPYSQAATAPAMRPPQQQVEADKQRREVEKHLREIEKHRREITDVHQREIERHLREIEVLQGNALAAEMKAQLEAELKRVGADSKRAEQELQDELRRSSLRQNELAELEKLHSLTAERAQREVQAEMEKAMRALQDKHEFSVGEAELLQKRAQLEADLQRLGREYTDKHPEMLEQRDRLDALNQQLLRLEQQGEAQRITEGYARSLAQLAELEAQLKTLQRSYTNNHPKVQAAKEQLEALRRELELRHHK